MTVLPPNSTALPDDILRDSERLKPRESCETVTRSHYCHVERTPARWTRNGKSSRIAMQPNKVRSGTAIDRRELSQFKMTRRRLVRLPRMYSGWVNLKSAVRLHLHGVMSWNDGRLIPIARMGAF